MKDDAKGTAAVVTSGESTVPLMTPHPRSGSRRGSVFRSVETIRPGQEPASARKLSAGSERQGCEQSLHLRLQMWVTGTTAIPDRSNPPRVNHAVEACHPQMLRCGETYGFPSANHPFPIRCCSSGQSPASQHSLERMNGACRDNGAKGAM